jgi:small-conductance mechanosensitive channel
MGLNTMHPSNPIIAASISLTERLENVPWLISRNRHIQALVALLSALVVAKVLDLFINRALGPLARRLRIGIDKQVVETLRKTAFSTVVIIGIGLAGKLEGLSGTGAWILYGALKTFATLVWLYFGMRCAAFALRWMGQHPTRFRVVQGATLPVFDISSKLIFIAVGVYFILLAWDANPAGWIASAGIVGIAVGFAAKDTLANLFAGVSILADAPYRIGDFIVLDGERGQVTRIGLRSTRILTRDDVEITIPNSTIANSKIVNESGGPWTKHRLRIPVSLAYGADIEAVRTILIEIARENRYVCQQPEARVRFRAFGDSALNFELLCWIEDPRDRGLTVDALNTTIYKALMHAGIEIPFPKRDIYIRQLPDTGTAKRLSEQSD